MGLLRVDVEQKFNDNDVINVLHFEGPGAILDNANALCTAIQAAYADELVSEFSDNWSLTGFTVYDMLSSDRFGLPVAPAGLPLVGANAGRTMPPGSALMVRWIYTGPKPNRGRTYLCGWTTSAAGNDGEVDTVALGKASNWEVDIRNIDLGAGNELDLVIYSASKSTPSVPVFNPVDNGLPDSVWRSQTRRQPGKGS